MFKFTLQNIPMKKTSLFLSLCVAAFTAAAQQSPIQYEVGFPNAVHHEANVSLTVPQVPAGTLTVRMSRSPPGRYATHEFGKNIYGVKAFDSKGNAIAINQVQGDVYEIPKHDGTVRVTYT